MTPTYHQFAEVAFQTEAGVWRSGRLMSAQAPFDVGNLDTGLIVEHNVAVDRILPLEEAQKQGLVALPLEPSQVDLRQLEQDILVQINAIRRNPTSVVTALQDMKKMGLQEGQITSPDGSHVFVQNTDMSVITSFVATYLDSGIATAQALQPMGELVWAEGLHQAALKWAQNPQSYGGHGNVGQRLEAYGTFGAYAETIGYAGETGAARAYDAYVDAGNEPHFGHRTMLVNPQYTHVGIGCYYPNPAGKITCVIDYCQDWEARA